MLCLENHNGGTLMLQWGNRGLESIFRVMGSVKFDIWIGSLKALCQISLFYK